MKIDEIERTIKSLTDTLSSPLIKSIQFAISSNIDAIDLCLLGGVSQKALLEIINKNVSEDGSKIKNIGVFKQLLVRARAKKQGSGTAPTSVPTIQRHDNKSSPINPINENCDTTDKLGVETKEWFAVNITRQPLIKRLTENGYSPSDVKSWGCSNESQVSSYLTSLLMRNK